MTDYTLSRLDDGSYEDQDGVSWDGPGDWLFIGILGGCGCGTSDALAERAIKLLKFFGAEWDDRKDFNVYDDPADEVMSHWMDSLDLIEHGTSIGGSWLTDKGRNILAQLDQEKPE